MVFFVGFYICRQINWIFYIIDEFFFFYLLVMFVLVVHTYRLCAVCYGDRYFQLISL